VTLDLPDRDFWTETYQLDTAATCAVQAAGFRYQRDPSATPRPLLWEHLEVLSQFRTPREPLTVWSIVSDVWDVRREVFEELIKG